MESAGDKPIDVGSGRACASFDLRSAAWMSIGTTHPTHGFVELSALPPFDESRRGDPRATRLHREAMTRPEHAFLVIELDGAVPRLTPDLSEPQVPRWTGPGVGVRAAPEPGDPIVRQTWTIQAPSGVLPVMRLRLRGRLDRPPLAEITELDPPAATGAVTEFKPAGRSVRIGAPALPADAVVMVGGAEVEWAAADDVITGSVAWPAHDGPLELTVEVVLSVADGGHSLPVGQGPADPDPIVGRALVYVRGCTTLLVRPGERAILTDHRVLPLSWTRDAYWQALALLAADDAGDRERVADHLRWLWQRCDRPDGRWVRSHHADGRRKDLAFQADQQLYPIVELADYWRVTGELPTGVAWDREVDRAWAATVTEIDAETGLIASSENAADDPSPAPFITASQILLWYAAERIAELADAGALRLDVGAIRASGRRARAAFGATLVSDAEPWPYAVDAHGGRVVYHDANDLPVALAPLWGFCDAEDPGWLATMAFAFCADNPAWVDGDRPGLGSLHTPGPWTLGDLQAWIRARVTRNRPSMAEVVSRLREVAFVDGMLPEAYSADRADDGRIRSWFAWPGAAFAALVLLDRAGRLEERLSARR